MQLNLKKCKEMLLDIRKNKTFISSLTINDTTLERVSSFKLLGLWTDDNLKWQTKTDYIIRKASMRLFSTLKKYGASVNDIRRFYICAIRPILEYGAQVWHGGLTNAQSECIEKVQKGTLRIIYSERDYEKILSQAGIHSLKSRRIDMYTHLIHKMSHPQHKLHYLLPNRLSEIRDRVTRQNKNLFYNFQCRTERFRNSPVFSSIELSNNSNL